MIVEVRWDIYGLVIDTPTQRLSCTTCTSESELVEPAYNKVYYPPFFVALIDLLLNVGLQDL